ncbi:hypothetical protein Pan241w_10990 [Gimesia alba]|uniref:DUF4031 domain-containing protein n=1 Tax=Gimesia alba TaxID=2527973 RepID=A0A517RAX8_9PLAN|nr:DUF4031 domain-containing protein [Gimesia alba]QDT41040.1 hypothetical protein Pan241w_10990 [Gimesia alba]
MTVYVDDYEGQFRRMIMCHMMSDESIEELIAMARKIGVNPKWIQHLGIPGKAVHFDICKSYRAKAIKAGAVELCIMTEDEKRNMEWQRVYRAARELNQQYIESQAMTV